MKKIYKFVSVAVIAVAMVVSFQMSKANNSTTSLTMENIEALAMADWEIIIGEPCINDDEGVCMWVDENFYIEYMCDGQFPDGTSIRFV